MRTSRATRIALLLCLLLVLAVAALTRTPGGGGSKPLLPAATARATPLPLVSALDFLPKHPARDGSVDYTAPMQAAIDAAAGRTLILPDFPVRVSRRPGTIHCLLAREPIEILGGPGSELREVQGGVQILRVEGARGVKLRGFTLRGAGGQGVGLAHGILQVFGGEDVSVEDVTAVASDADGIVIADARRVAIRGCRAVRTSKSGLYLSRCQAGVIADCVVEDGIGHRTAQGALVGAGIQISSCADVVCSGNVVRGGVGIGILCDANSTGVEPTGCAIVANRVSDVRNPEDMDVSGGIRLQNSASATRTRTLVSSNVVERCGAHGIHVERHDEASLLGNAVLASDRSAICVGQSRAVSVIGNVVLEADAMRTGSQAGLHLLHGAADVVARDNRIETRATPPYVLARLDESGAAGHSLEATVVWGPGPPASGLWSRGDVVENAAPAPGSPARWICTSGGTPGLWSPSAPIQ